MRRMIHARHGVPQFRLTGGFFQKSYQTYFFECISSLDRPSCFDELTIAISGNGEIECLSSWPLAMFLEGSLRFRHGGHYFDCGTFPC